VTAANQTHNKQIINLTKVALVAAFLLIIIILFIFISRFIIMGFVPQMYLNWQDYKSTKGLGELT
jgi:hypothetical protein